MAEQGNEKLGVDHPGATNDDAHPMTADEVEALEDLLGMTSAGEPVEARPPAARAGPNHGLPDGGLESSGSALLPGPELEHWDPSTAEESLLPAALGDTPVPGLESDVAYRVFQALRDLPPVF